MPNLNVAGFWDQEDPWGPWEIYRRSRDERSEPLQLHRRRPVVPRAVAQRRRPSRSARFRSAATTRPSSSARRSRRRGSATGCTARARSSRGRRRRSRPDRTRGRRTPTWPPRVDRHEAVSAARTASLSFDAPPTGDSVSCSTSPIPRTRCRTGSVRSRRRIRPATGAAGKWPISDSSTDRPDVATWVSAPLDSRPHRHRRARGRLCSRRRRAPTAISSSS